MWITLCVAVSIIAGGGQCTLLDFKLETLLFSHETRAQGDVHDSNAACLTKHAGRMIESLINFKAFYASAVEILDLPGEDPNVHEVEIDLLDHIIEWASRDILKNVNEEDLAQSRQNALRSFDQKMDAWSHKLEKSLEDKVPECLLQSVKAQEMAKDYVNFAKGVVMLISAAASSCLTT